MTTECICDMVSLVLECAPVLPVSWVCRLMLRMLRDAVQLYVAAAVGHLSGVVAHPAGHQGVLLLLDVGGWGSEAAHHRTAPHHRETGLCWKHKQKNSQIDVYVRIRANTMLIQC